MRTIRSNREIDDLFREGARVSHPAVNALVGRTRVADETGGRIVFVAGKRLGGAVQRNRAKRVLRAAARRSGEAWPGFDVALIARPSTARSSAASLDEALRHVGRAIRTMR